MFKKLFKRKEKIEEQFIVANINARIQPLDRGEIYEDPLDEELVKLSLGEVSGGGTLLNKNGEVDCCDVEIQVNDSSDETVQQIKSILENLGVPKGSKLIIEETELEMPIGTNEGLAVYLNGTDLPDDVYEECDVNIIYSEFNRLLDEEGSVQGHWEGDTETALYLYGPSSDTMSERIQDFVDSYPLCQKCRIVKIA